MNHTSGPWRVEGRPGYAAPIVMAGKQHIAKVLYKGGSEDRTVDANARLIAAAPELLEALKASIFVMEAYFESAPVMHMGSGEFTKHQQYLTTIRQARAVIVGLMEEGSNE